MKNYTYKVRFIDGNEKLYEAPEIKTLLMFIEAYTNYEITDVFSIERTDIKVI